MRKISPLQLFFTLFITRAFLSVTYGANENHLSVVLCMLSIMVSVGVQCLLVIPPILFAKSHPDKNFLTYAFEKSKTLGTVTACVYAGFFIYEISRQLGVFSYFIKTEFPEIMPAFLLIIILSAASLYGASRGICGICRASCVGGVIFLVLFFVIILGVTGKYDIYNIQTATPYPKNLPTAFFTDVFQKIGRSDELVCLPFLLSYTEKSHKKATFGYFATKFAVMEVTVFFSTLILGEYAIDLNLPFYTLSTYAKTSVIERYDSIYMLVWTISAVMKTAVLIYLAWVCLKNILPNHPKTSLFTAWVIPTVFATFLCLKNSYDSIFFRPPATIIVIILCSAVPLVLQILPDRREKSRKKF